MGRRSNKDHIVGYSTELAHERQILWTFRHHFRAVALGSAQKLTRDEEHHARDSEQRMCGESRLRNVRLIYLSRHKYFGPIPSETFCLVESLIRSVN